MKITIDEVVGEKYYVVETVYREGMPFVYVFYFIDGDGTPQTANCGIDDYTQYERLESYAKSNGYKLAYSKEYYDQTVDQLEWCEREIQKMSRSKIIDLLQFDWR